jgi:predicted transcriptional regulator
MGNIAQDIMVEREHRAWELRIREHMTQAEIASELGIDQATVSRLLARAARARLEDKRQLIETQIAEQFDRLDHIFAEAMRAWEASKEPTKLVAKRMSRAADSSSDERPRDEDITTRVEDQDGNTRYLDTAMKALGDLRKLLGIDAPSRVELAGQGGGPLQSNVVVYLPDNGRGDGPTPVVLSSHPLHRNESDDS